MKSSREHKQEGLVPFATKSPDLSLAPAIEESLRVRFRQEVARLREMNGEPLPSLG